MSLDDAADAAAAFADEYPALDASLSTASKQRLALHTALLSDVTPTTSHVFADFEAWQATTDAAYKSTWRAVRAALDD